MATVQVCSSHIQGMYISCGGLYFLRIHLSSLPFAHIIHYSVQIYVWKHSHKAALFRKTVRIMMTCFINLNLYLRGIFLRKFKNESAIQNRVTAFSSHSLQRIWQGLIVLERLLVVFTLCLFLEVTKEQSLLLK